MAGPIDGLGNVPRTGNTPYDYMTPGRNYGWSPFSTAPGIATVVDPATWTYSSQPILRESGNYTTNGIVNQAISGNIALDTPIDAMTAELAGYVPANSVAGTSNQQFLAATGNNLGLGFLNQGNPSTNGAGQQLFPGIGTFLPGVDGVQAVPNRNQFAVTNPSVYPEPYGSWQLPMNPLNGPVSGGIAATPLTTLDTTASLLSTAASGQFGTVTGASATPTVAATPLTQSVAQPAQPAVATSSPMSSNAALGDPSMIASLGQMSNTELFQQSISQANQAASDVSSQWSSILQEAQAWEQNKAANKAAAASAGAGGAMAGGGGNAGGGMPASGGSGVNPQMAMMMATLSQTMGQLIYKMAQQNGGKVTPELQAALQSIQQMQAMAGGVSGAAGQTQQITTGQPSMQTMQNANNQALEAVRATPLKNGRTGTCVATVAENLDQAFANLPAGVKPTVFGPTGPANENNTLDAAAQMVKSGCWETVGSQTQTIDTKRGKITFNMMSPAEFVQAAKNGQIPAGAVIAQTRHGGWRMDVGASGNDLSILTPEGVHNYQKMPHLVYGQNTGPVMVLIPKQKGQTAIA